MGEGWSRGVPALFNMPEHLYIRLGKMAPEAHFRASPGNSHSWIKHPQNPPFFAGYTARKC